MKTMHMWDGDTYPTLEFPLSSGDAPRDSSNMAVWFDIYKDGAFLVRRPGKVLSPKSNGRIDCFFRGWETDWAGSGATLVAYPVIMAPFTSSDITADTVLLNGSFDDFGGSTPTQLATNWTMVGTQASSVYTVTNTGPKPASIYGNYQSIYRPLADGSDQLRQVAASLNVRAGDFVTFGCWVRGEAISNTSANNALKLIFLDNSIDNTITTIPAGSYDWTFLTVEKRLSANQTSIDSRITTHVATGTWQFDDAATFIGRYRKLQGEPRKIVVHRRVRPSRTLNQIPYGGFEHDSDGNGMADGFMKVGSGFTLSMEQDPINVRSGLKSQKVVCSGGTGVQRIHTEIRGQFHAGDTYQPSVWVKTSGALTGSAPTITLKTGPFDGTATVGTPTSIGQSLASFTQFTAPTVLASNCNQMRMEISFSGASGTLWLDDAELKKI